MVIKVRHITLPLKYYHNMVFRRFYILSLTSFISSTACYCYADDRLNAIIKHGDFLAAKKNFDDAISTYKKAIRNCESRDTIIDLKIKIADCSFNDREYYDSIKYYKSILKQYEYFYQKDYVVYKLCLSLKHLADWGYERDATRMNDLINWIKYYKKNCHNNDYLEELGNIYYQGMQVIRRKDFENIKFYFDNNIFNSAIFCCEWFLKTHKNSEYTSEACWYKIKSTYLKNKKIVDKVKKKKNKESLEYVLLNVFTEIRDILEFIKNCKNNNKLHIKDIDELYSSCYELLCATARLKNNK
ncbi:MAG: hypothetical protein II393_01240 [Cytophagales bacterium]|nr:hypothetical protein [Cytophagales bacterium]